MSCNAEEIAQCVRFGAGYARALAPVMIRIERQVCGCDFGGSSWTTVAQADEIARRLGLDPGTHLLELGAGSGWPALRMVERASCRAMFVDLPRNALGIAIDRAAEMGMTGRLGAVVADAADLPFANRTFDAVSHSDLLCCLVRKRRVLQECRRIVRADGRMVFTVISIPAGLSPEMRARAEDAGPTFIASEADYPTLLAETGWRVMDRIDLSAEYAAAGERQIAADIENAEDLAALVGEDVCSERLASWRNHVAATRDGLLRREMFVAEPDT